jgi:hypothetical protein
MAADVGTGVVISSVLGINGTFAADVLAVSGSGISRPSVDTSHMGTTGGRTFMPGDLYDTGTTEVEFAIDADAGFATTRIPGYSAAFDPASTTKIKIQFPTPVGGSSGGSFECLGFVTDLSWGAVIEERMTGTFTIKWSGTPTWAPGS